VSWVLVVCCPLGFEGGCSVFRLGFEGGVFRGLKKGKKEDTPYQFLVNDPFVLDIGILHIYNLLIY